MPVNFTLQYAEKLNMESKSVRITKVMGQDRPESVPSATGSRFTVASSDAGVTKVYKMPEITYSTGVVIKKEPEYPKEEEPLPEKAAEPAQDDLTITKEKRKYTKRQVNA